MVLLEASGGLELPLVAGLGELAAEAVGRTSRHVDPVFPVKQFLDRCHWDFRGSSLLPNPAHPSHWEAG